MKESKLYFSETENNSLGEYLGDYSVSQDEINYGVWDGEKIILTENNRIRYERDLLLTDVEANKKYKCGEVNRLLNQILNDGFSYLGAVYDSDIVAIQNIHGAYTIYNSTGYFSGSWWDKNNTNHTMTTAEFAAFAESFFGFINSKRRQARTMKDAINNLQTIQEIKEFQIIWT
ncbi:MAG: DUF4376 domain-containing protein [Leptospiraceae bacterium]|nr:DUF4376 domain-containing protein [Leptospiraceae bacterium]